MECLLGFLRSCCVHRKNLCTYVHGALLLQVDMTSNPRFHSQSVMNSTARATAKKPTSQAITEASEPRPHPACPKQGTSYHTSCIATSRQSGPPFSTMPPVLTQVARASDALPLVATSTPTHNLPITADIQQDAKKLMRSMTTR